MRMCDSFNASHYGLPENDAVYNNKIKELENLLQDSVNVIT